MATWTTRTRIITRREWVVPLPNDHAQLLQALTTARQARADALARGLQGDPTFLGDDSLMISGDSEEIVIWYETHGLGPT